MKRVDKAEKAERCLGNWKFAIYNAVLVAFDVCYITHGMCVFRLCGTDYHPSLLSMVSVYSENAILTARFLYDHSCLRVDRI
jgi:hypothetical protein